MNEQELRLNCMQIALSLVETNLKLGITSEITEVADEVYWWMTEGDNKTADCIGTEEFKCNMDCDNCTNFEEEIDYEEIAEYLRCEIAEHELNIIKKKAVLEMFLAESGKMIILADFFEYKTEEYLNKIEESENIIYNLQEKLALL